MPHYTQRIYIAFALLTGLYSASIYAKDYTLQLNPIGPADEVIKVFTPLAKYLEKATGEKITLICENNYLASWQRLLRRPAPDLAIQPPHIASYLISIKGYRPLARVDGVVSFSVVTTGDDLIFDTKELIGKRVAALGSPSLGAILMNNLYSNPIRQPVFVGAKNAADAVNLLQYGEAKAAVIPTSMVSNFENLNVVESTEQLPLISIVGSSTLPEPLAKTISQALTNANQTAEGQAMLEAINIPAGFIAFKAGDLKDLHTLLRGTYGY